MKTISLNSFAIFMAIMLLIRLGNTPTVESSPTNKASCILKCCGDVCRSAARVCLGWGSQLGAFAILAAAGCFLIAGGGCAVCVAACMAIP